MSELKERERNTMRQRTKLNSKKYGALWNSLGSMMYGINSFIMLTLVSRIGTVEQAGHFGIAFTTAQMLYIVGILGISHYQMTDYKEKYQFSDYLLVKIISCCLMIICCFFVIVFLGFRGEKLIYTVALTLLMMLNAIGELYENLFFQKNRLDFSGSALFYRTFWSLVLFSMVLLLTNIILLAIVAQIATNFILTCYYARKAESFFPIQKSPFQIEHIKSLISECILLFFSLLIMGLTINISKYGVEFLLNDQAQGYYSMIFMPVQVINLCSQFLFKPFLNQYANLLSEKKYGEFSILLKRQILFTVGLALICCGCAYWLGVPVLSFLYHKNLVGLTVPLIVLVFGGGIFAGCQIMYYIFVILRCQTYIFQIYIFTCPVIAIVTAALINMQGLFGAALSFTIAHILIVVCYIWLLKRILRRDLSA